MDEEQDEEEGEEGDADAVDAMLPASEEVRLLCLSAVGRCRVG